MDEAASVANPGVRPCLVGGPVVVLHFNGHKWSKLATGQFGFGPFWQQSSSDGSGGLWLPMAAGFDGTFLVHYAGGKLTKDAVLLQSS